MPPAVRHLVALGAALVVWSAALGVRAQHVHVVRPGDTLARIARRYHVSIEALSGLNRIRGTTVREGQRIEIPGREGRRGRGRRYRVRAGDTVARIARRYHIPAAELRAANGMRDDAIREGQSLLVPLRGQDGAALRAELRNGTAPTASNPPVAIAIATAAATRAEELALGSTPAAQRLLRDGADPGSIAAAGSVEGMDGTLLLPVEGGHFMRGWGSGLNGYHLAIDIGAPTGTTASAAERGIVAYSGHGIRGYGNMVIIVHPNGWVTAYAHNRVNLVVAGQIVRRGEPVCEVGATGFARGSHLHFIFAYGAEHCDATPLFQPRIVQANGQEPEGPTLIWDGEHQPSGIRCLPREDRPHPHYRGDHRHRAR